MAILNTCCCWKSIRRASYACAVYSLFYYAFLVACLWIYSIEMMNQGLSHSSVLLPRPNEVEFWVRYLVFIILGLSLVGPITCILLFIGIWTDKKILLLPWISDGTAILLLEVVHVGYIICKNWTNPNPAVAMIITVDFFSSVLNIYSLLCVISQFQEFKAGRGRAVDDQRLYGPVQFSRHPTLISCETGRKTTAIYESKAQTNGISPRHKRMSIRSVSRGPSIKISRVDNGAASDLSGNNAQTSSESCDADVTTGSATCAGSLTGDSSSFSQEHSNPPAGISSSRPGSNKRAQFPTGECPAIDQGICKEESGTKVDSVQTGESETRVMKSSP